MVVYIVIAVIVAVAAIFLYRKKAVKKVPQGLQIFNSNGDIILDYAEDTCQIYGFVQTVAGKSGSVNDKRITANTMLIPYSYVFVTEATEGTVSYDQSIENAIFPNFTVSSGTISWTYAPKHTPDGGKWKNGDAYIQVGFLYGGNTV